MVLPGSLASQAYSGYRYSFCSLNPGLQSQCQAHHLQPTNHSFPASGNYPNVQGDRGLYSIRSPCALPVNIHIWQTPRTNVMARKGLQTAALIAVLASFGSLKRDNIEARDICKHYRCWKSPSISKKWSQCVPNSSIKASKNAGGL